MAVWLHLQVRRSVKGHWIYVGGPADSPYVRVAWIVPVGMSCETEVGCSKRKKLKKNSLEGGRGKWLLF